MTNKPASIENVKSVLFTLHSEISDQIDDIKHIEYPEPATVDLTSREYVYDEPNAEWNHVTFELADGATLDYTSEEVSEIYNSAYVKKTQGSTMEKYTDQWIADQYSANYFDESATLAELVELFNSDREISNDLTGDQIFELANDVYGWLQSK